MDNRIGKTLTIMIWVVMVIIVFIVMTPANANGAGLSATIYTDPTIFNAATASLGIPTVIDFEGVTACPDNTIQGCTPFDGNFYANKGITFRNPNDYPLFIAPGGLFWNLSNSLSVGRFPFDPLYPKIYNEDDDLIVALDPPRVAVGFTFVDLGYRRNDEFVQFLDSDGNVVRQVNLPPDFAPYRAFLGIVSIDHPIALINIVEAPYDADDVNYDDFVLYAETGIKAAIDIAPDTLNLKSKGRWIIGYIELPQGYEVSSINVSTVRISDINGDSVDISAEDRPGEIGDYDNDGIPDLTVKFNRSDVDALSLGDVTLTVSGELYNGTPFEGSDTIWIIDKGKK
jgi:hypothetical protein